MIKYFTFTALAMVLETLAGLAAAEVFTGAQYADPVDRYGHFALGRPHEYSRLTAITDTGRKLVFQLPDNEVFEDLVPRLVRLTRDEQVEILTIVSRRNSGSRLVLLGLVENRLEVVSQSPEIGIPMRWLNPVAVADLDGDGRAEISAVITPHINGILKVYRRNGENLLEISSLKGFSNHVYRTTELDLSAAMLIDGKMRLLVPDNKRKKLRIVDLESGRLVESGQCSLKAPVTGPVRVVSASQVSVVTQSGKLLLVPVDCMRKMNK